MGIAGRRSVVSVIETDSAVRASLKFLLETAGFDVRTHDGSKCPGASDLNGVDCIVLAHGLNGLDGLRVLALLRGNGVTAPAILMMETDRGRPDPEFPEIGVLRVLDTPLNPDQLLDCVEGIVAGRKAVGP